MFKAQYFLFFSLTSKEKYNHRKAILLTYKAYKACVFCVKIVKFPQFQETPTKNPLEIDPFRELTLRYLRLNTVMLRFEYFGDMINIHN